MKNYKVEATMKFTDKEENGIKRNVGDIFETTKERYEFLKQNNAVKLIEIMKEENEFITPIIGHRKDDVEYITPLDKETTKKLGETIKKYIQEEDSKPKKKKSSKK